MTKDVENTSESFLSRWAKRRADVRAEEAKSIGTHNANPSTSAPIEAKMPQTAIPERGLPSNSNESIEESPPLPAIESLTQESDFSPFMGKDVASDLRNQAMKKLFTDPHYNVQDGLDIYIGDYTKSDPIPLEMLRKMTQSKALFLFEEEEKAEADAAALEAAKSDAITAGVPDVDVMESSNGDESLRQHQVSVQPDLLSTDVTDAGIKSE